MEFSTADCATFDVASDPSYPVDVIEEHLLRQLNYEGLEGLAEVVSWLVKSAGCEAEYELLESPSKAQVAAITDKIDKACAAHAHPSSYPILTKTYLSRVKTLAHDVAMTLSDSENFETLSYWQQLVAGLAMAQVQSLRMTATIFAGIMLPTDIDGVLARVLSARCADVSSVLRKRALAALNGTDVDAVRRALNDPNASVRVAALHALPASNLASDRVVQMAGKDVDRAVRRAALRTLHDQELTGEQLEQIAALRFDADELTRKLSMEIVVARLEAPVLLKVLDLVVEDVESADAVAYGLNKRNDGGFWASEIVNLLTRDLSKETRKKNGMHELAAALADESAVTRLLYVLRSLMQLGECVDLIEDFSTLLVKMQVSTPLLAAALVVTSNLPFQEAQKTADGERAVLSVATAVKEIFETRSEREILESASAVFAALPEPLQHPLCVDLYEHYRISLAGDASSESASGTACKLIILARFVDASSVLRLPIWNSDGMVLQLVKVIAMRSDAPTMRTAVQKLAQRKEPAVDAILNIFVAARMRNIDLEIPLPVDVSVTEPTSADAWRAAVAAGVI